MPDYVTVCWRPEATTFPDWADRLAASIPSKATRAQDLRLNLSDGPPSPIVRPRPDGSVIGAVLSARLENDDDALALTSEVQNHCSFTASYRVANTVPLDYQRDWADGETSPGVKQVSLFPKHPDLTQDQFIQHWHGTHTPLALEVHPLWRYVRGVVEHALTADAPEYDAIVELHFREEADVTDMMRFYGGDIKNMKRIAKDVRSFIDMDKIEITQTSERILIDGEHTK